MYKPNKTLLECVAATLAGSFTYTIPLQHSQLVKDGMVEVNPEITDPNGKGIATRATQAGIDAVKAWNESQTSTQTEALKTSGKFEFVIEDGVPMPKVTHGNGGGNSIYPFDKLDVNQSFFVPNNEKHPNIAKALASTVSNANLRYAVKVPGQFRTNRKGNQVPLTEQKREFKVRSVDGGARVWRIK